MADPHAVAVKEANRLTRRLGELFGKLGTSEHPRGAMLTAYRTALRSLRGNLDNSLAVRDALTVLRRELQVAMTESLDMATEEAARAAREVLAANGLPQVAVQTQNGLTLEAWMQSVDDQIQKVHIAASTRMLDESALLGDAGHAGVLTPGPVIREGARYLTASSNHTYDEMMQQAVEEGEYFRQAVAAIDERTTDCCLQVHAQVVGLDEPFNLTGTPRFADEMEDPPFHWFCRTSVALVHRDQLEDELTQKMEKASKRELAFREEARQAQRELEAELKRLDAQPDVRIRKNDSKKVKEIRQRLREWRERERQEIHPAHATSMRPDPSDPTLFDFSWRPDEPWDGPVRDWNDDGPDTPGQKVENFLDEGLSKGHRSSSTDEQAVVKDEIIQELSDKTGLSYNRVNDFIHQWAETSNDDDLRSLYIQKDAADILGIELAPWQKARLEQRLAAGGAESRLLPASEQKQIIRAMYDRTQAQLRSAGVGDTVRLRRGMYLPKAMVADWEEGQIINRRGSVLESWSLDEDIAHNFAKSGVYSPSGPRKDLRGFVLESDIPTNHIIGTARSGFGCLSEGEFVTIGSYEGRDKLISIYWQEQDPGFYENLGLMPDPSYLKGVEQPSKPIDPGALLKEMGIG